MFVDGGACATAQWHNGQSKPGSAASDTVLDMDESTQTVRQIKRDRLAFRRTLI